MKASFWTGIMGGLLALGIFMGDKYNTGVVIPGILIFISLLGLGVSLYLNNNIKKTIFIITGFFFMGLLIVGWKALEFEKNRFPLDEGQWVNLYGKVVSPPVIKGNRIHWELNLEGIGEKGKSRENCRILIRTSLDRWKEGKTGQEKRNTVDEDKTKEEMLKPQEIKAGDLLKLSGMVITPRKPLNSWEFDYRKYLQYQGISGVIYVLHPQKIKKIGHEEIWLGIIYNSREKIRRSIKEALPPVPGSLLTGMILGDRTELSGEIQNSYQKTGTLHLIVASGFHVSIIISFFYFILGFFGIKKQFRYIITIIPLIFYILLIGGTPSIIRAGIMGLIFLVIRATGLEYDILNSLFMAGILGLLIHPYDLFAPGFQMSFLAVWGIITLFPLLKGERKKEEKTPPATPKEKEPHRQKSKNPHQNSDSPHGDTPTELKEKIKNKLNFYFYKIKEYITDTVLITICAQVLVFPVITYYFNNMSLVSVPANIPLIPLASVIVPGGFLGSLLSIISPPLGKFVLSLLEIPLGLSISTVTMLANLPFSWIKLPSPSMTFIIIYYSTVVVFSYRGEWMKKYKKIFYIIILFSLSFFMLREAYLLNQKEKIIFFNTRDYQACLIEKRNCNLLFIRHDEERGRPSLEIKWNIYQYLLKRGIGKLDILILSGGGDNIDNILEDLNEFQPKIILDIHPPPEELKEGSGQRSPSSNKVIYIKSPTRILLPDSETEIRPETVSSRYLLSYRRGDTAFFITNPLSPLSDDIKYYSRTTPYVITGWFEGGEEVESFLKEIQSGREKDTTINVLFPQKKKSDKIDIKELISVDKKGAVIIDMQNKLFIPP